MRSIVCVLLLCLLGSISYAQEPAPPAQSIDALQQQLEAILAETHTPGLSVAIVGRDGPQWVAGLGKADVATDRPATADTLFRIGSTSKAFAALSILKLVDQGDSKKMTDFP